MANGPPDPTHFADGSPVPRNTGPQSPVSSTSELPKGITQDQAYQVYNAVKSNPDLAGVVQTIGDDVGKVVGWVEKILPKNADGSTDWGAVVKDVGGWVAGHASDILAFASGESQAQRLQKADQLGQQAVAAAQKSYDARAPLRLAGQAGMLDPHASTPNLSNLSAQGQNGSSIQAPLPLAAPQTAYQNAGSVAGNNPFTKGLPMAPAPVSSAPPIGPGGPNVPGQPPGGFKPYQPLPLAPGGGTGPLPPTVSLPPQSGPIKAGPKDRPLQLAPTQVPPNGPVPVPKTATPPYPGFAPLPMAGS